MRRILPILVALAVCLGGCASAPGTLGDALPDPVRFIALGDSYTAGTTIGAENAWPAQLAMALGDVREVVPSAVAGEGWNTKRLSREIRRAALTPTFDLVVLEIGANDVVLGFGEENFREGLDMLAADIGMLAAPGAAIVVLSIPDFRVSPWGRERSDRGYDIEAYNAILSSFASNLGAIHVDITSVCADALDDPSLIAPDDLHFAPAMHARWVELIGGSPAAAVPRSVEDGA